MLSFGVKHAGHRGINELKIDTFLHDTCKYNLCVFIMEGGFDMSTVLQSLISLLILALILRLLWGVAKGLVKLVIFVLMFGVPIGFFVYNPTMATIFLVSMMILFFARKRIYAKVRRLLTWNR